MKKHVNIPIFIPHMGCPNQCVFCNQRTISGVAEFDVTSVKNEIDKALATVCADAEREIAFFGGSFTGIDQELMISLLELAYSYVKNGQVTSVRCSTRPDYINDEIIDILKKYGVETVELGLQSSNNKVLSLCKRGHTCEDELLACRKIVDAGIKLVGQMMIGLPGSNLDDELLTAEFIVDSGAVGARIYPTVVFKDTELCDMAEAQMYNPISLSDAVERSARVLEIFDRNNIEVIRIGLCASDNLSSADKYYGGPNHPALGELVEGRLYYNRIRRNLFKDDSNKGNLLTIYVAKGCISKATGQRRINAEMLREEFGYLDVRFKEDPTLSGYSFKIEEERKRKCI